MFVSSVEMSDLLWAEILLYVTYPSVNILHVKTSDGEVEIT